MSARAPRPAQANTAEAAIADLLDDFELVFERQRRVRAGRPPTIRVVRDSHRGESRLQHAKQILLLSRADYLDMSVTMRKVTMVLDGQVTLRAGPVLLDEGRR